MGDIGKVIEEFDKIQHLFNDGWLLGLVAVIEDIFKLN